MVSGGWGEIECLIGDSKVCHYLNCLSKGWFWCGVFTENGMTKHDPYLLNIMRISEVKFGG